jgi:hypothetical protein
MRENGIEPTIEGPHYAFPCPCGHRACKSWMVANVADTQGVGFSQAQAVFVADMLNTFHRGNKLVAISLTSSAAFLLRERGL